MVVILGGVMVKGGCTCEEWEDEWALSGIDPTLKYEDGVWQELTHVHAKSNEEWRIITHCSWCGSPLTPPEEEECSK